MTHAAPAENDLDWARAALGGDGDGPQIPYLARPNHDHPTLLLPLQPRVVTSAALRRHHDDRSILERVTGLAGQLAARAGVIRFGGGDVVSLTPFPLIDHLAVALGEPRLVASVSLGPPRRNRKPVVQLVRPDGVVVGFAKVGWSDLTRRLVTNEAEWLHRVDGRMPPGLRAPAVLHQSQIEQPTGAVDVVVTSPLPASIFSYRRNPISVATMASLARLEPGGRETFGNMALLEEWRSGALASLLDLDRLVERHAEVVVETGMWHGDLTPWNTATTRGQSAVWDWEFAGGGRPVGFDALHVEFETVRRASPRSEPKAIGHIEAAAEQVLASIPGPATTTDPDAVIDLYFCDLLAREALLSGEGWQPQHLGPLDTHLITALERRITGIKR